MELKDIIKRAVRRWAARWKAQSAAAPGTVAVQEATHRKDTVMTSLDCRVAAFAEARYDLRHNVLTGQAEFRPKGEERTPFRPLTDRDLNSLCLAAHEAGIPCWDRDVNRYVCSDRLPDHHPFTGYFNRLPAWDGKERLDGLARRVADNPLWRSSFRRWMLAMTAQWMGLDNSHANSVDRYWSAGNRAGASPLSAAASCLPNWPPTTPTA